MKVARWGGKVGTREQVDAHVHLSSYLREPEKYGGREALLLALFRARDSGVRCMVQGGIDPSDWVLQFEVRELARAQCPEVQIIPCVGLHPWWVSDLERTDSEIGDGVEGVRAHLSEAQARGEVLWAGELGLDAMERFGGGQGRIWDRQVDAFRRQWAVVQELGNASTRGTDPIPVALHLVGPAAHREALRLIEPLKPSLTEETALALPFRGLVHRFNADAITGTEWLKRGFLLSLGPELTRPGHKLLHSALSEKTALDGSEVRGRSAVAGGQTPEFRAPSPSGLGWMLPDKAFVFESDAPHRSARGKLDGPEIREEVIRRFREKRVLT